MWLGDGRTSSLPNKESAFRSNGTTPFSMSKPAARIMVTSSSEIVTKFASATVSRSATAKKKSRSRRIGPERLAPYWFC